MTVHQEHLRACRTAFAGCDTSDKILLVGEDNPLSSEPEYALFCSPTGCAGQRLQDKIFGLPRANYLALWRTNLCVGGWSAKSARERARVLLGQETPWDVVVMLGVKVEEAFSQVLGTSTPLRPFCRQSIGGMAQKWLTLVSLPHPSGRNRVWNIPGSVGTARKLMQELAPLVPWGSYSKEND